MSANRKDKPAAKAVRRGAGRPPVDKANDPDMTGEQFAAWLAVMGFADTVAARRLGASPSTVGRYKATGGPASLALACAAIAAGLPHWHEAEKETFRKASLLLNAVKDIG